jgi:16S rRNA (cytosine967-C5)-methyltransferase
LWLLFRLGAVQLLLLPGLPPHAAVHETVQLAKDIGMPRWTGIVNGVLRSLSRLATEDFQESPSPASVPFVETQPAAVGSDESQIVIRHRRLSREVFPPPEFDRAGYVSQAFSLPRWLIERWQPEFSDTEIVRLAGWFMTSGQMALRVNPLRVSRDAFLAALRAQRVAAWEGMSPESVRLAESTRIDTLPGFGEGWFSVQDEASLVPTRLLEPQAGEQILDLCAAPGGKSTHMAELMGDQGRVVACDVGSGRTRLIRQSTERLGLSSIETHTVQDDGTNVPEGPFDAAIVDAPCTNTGVLGKRPEVRWRLTPVDFTELADIQSRILLTAASRVKPGGRLVYSTCSIDEHENESIVRAFVEANPDWSLERDLRSVPGRPGDGGYAALLRRRP